MSKGAKIAIGIAAAVAIPFAAPYIATTIAGSSALLGTGLGTFLGGAGGSALIGAGLGGAAGYATTGTARGALMGAGLGGLGGFVGGGGMSGLFGGAGGAAGAAANPAVGLAAQSPASWAAGTTVLPAAATGTTAALAAAPTLGAATPGVLSGLTNSIIQNAPNAVAQLSMLAFNKPPEELTEAQNALLAQMQADAKENKELFTQRLQMAQDLVRRGQNPDFVGAYANAIVPAARALRDEERMLLARGGTPEAAATLRRQGIIETTARAPRSVAVAGEEGRRTMATGAALMPTQAPVDRTAETQLRIAERNKAEEDRQREQQARIVGGLFGTPSFQQNRYGGITPPGTTPPATAQPRQAAGLTEPTYTTIYSNPSPENWSSQVFGNIG